MCLSCHLGGTTPYRLWGGLGWGIVLSFVFVVVYPGVVLWTLEWQLRGNVIIHKAQKAIQAGDRRPRRFGVCMW
jgi:hypothetical protein